MKADETWLTLTVGNYMTAARKDDTKLDVDNMSPDPEQFENVKAKRNRKNIYIPDFEAEGRSTARYAFPAMKLSLDKEQAGQIKIAKPRLKNGGE